MKVLHIQKVGGIGGSERHLLSLLPALAAAGIEVKMHVLSGEGSERFVGPMKELGIDTSVAPAGPDLSPASLLRVIRAVRRFRPDLIHTHLMHADVYGQIAGRVTGIPAVCSIHGTLSIYRRQPYRSIARLTGHLARRTITISDHAGRFVKELGLAPSDRIRMVHYGIDSSLWGFSEKKRERARADLGLEPKDVAVAVASRLVEHKGHHFLLDAVAKARTQVPQLKLLIAGGGPLLGSLEEHARQLVPAEAVRFLGYVQDVPMLMNACDVVVFPTLASFGEGFGLAALEGMAAGRPVVASAVDSLPEIVVDGETGFLVPPGEVHELAERLIRLTDDQRLRKQMGERGRERSQAAFSLEAMAQKTRGVYEEVL
jgi:glycosyltransferase involved in cell wall biosynthesis